MTHVWTGSSVPPGACPRRGFTLVELLVVMAVSVILLGLLFVPMLSGFNFVRRGQLTAMAQENARLVMNQLQRELADALFVCVAAGDYSPVRYRDVRGSHPVRYDGYINVRDESGRAHRVYGAMVDFVPADDTLGLHGGKLMYPLGPQVKPVFTKEGQEIHPVVVRYFVGLSRPYKEDARGRVTAANWVNPYERPMLMTAEPDNTYVLFRCEFDPYDPAFSNWAVPDPANPKSDVYVINPNFFYDTRVVTSLSGVKQAYSKHWRKASVAVVPLKDIDLVRFVASEGSAEGTKPTVQAVSTVTFTPTRVVNDTAVPAAPTAADGVPTTYVADHGNWSGLQNDHTVDAQQVALLGPLTNPHITVYPGVGTDPVFDSAQAHQGAPDYPGRNRTLTWDSRSGTVNFARRAEPFVFTVTSTHNGWRFRPTDSISSPQLRAVARIVAGTEVVRIRDPETGTVILLRRAEPGQLVDTAERPIGWNEATKGPYPSALPPPGTYTLNPDGWMYIGYPYPGPANPMQPVPVPEGKVVEVLYQYQTNQPDDVVRVDYTTKSLLNITLGVRTYDPSNGKPILIQLSGKVRLRNVGR
ncbi:MAG: PilW family protein [Armatimonadota bacterium]